MARPTHIQIDATALRHNLGQVKQYASGKQVIAMVKANAYGCGLSAVVPVLEKDVDVFGVACIEEAMAIRALGIQRDCLLIQGFFSADETQLAAKHRFQCVVHRIPQLRWLLDSPLDKKITVWVKVNTGMHRLGFMPEEVADVINALHACPWIDDNVGLMTHLACADEPDNPVNQHQLDLYNELDLPLSQLKKSIANSAAIMALPHTHADVVRPGIMLYGVSPFPGKTAIEHGLMPVMHFVSALTVIHHYPAGVCIGYGGTWKTTRPSLIGVVAVGYGDGYPRHISENTPVWINGNLVPIVGRISMDMLTIDLTDYPGAVVGDAVELWGKYVPVEIIARSAGTIAYELLCQVTPRVRT